jgi:hydroxymethylpyrimidine/phosphomethylpyrimidine kinase
VTPTPPKVLTIAGSDSGGGAGIQADLKTFAAHGCYGLSVITALTAQNTTAVTAVHEAPPEFVRAQLDAVLSDIGCNAAKTGMLSSAPLIEAVADRLAVFGVPNLVVDPVMVSKSGHRLLREDAIEALTRHLIPMARLITPNAEEAGVLLGRPIRTIDDALAAAPELGWLGPRAVLVKGGHLDATDEAVDVLWEPTGLTVFRAPRLNARHTHGTGCTLSAAIAANLALGKPLREAVEAARTYLRGALEHAYPVGNGIGPVNHLWQQTEG